MNSALIKRRAQRGTLLTALAVSGMLFVDATACRAQDTNAVGSSTSTSTNATLGETSSPPAGTSLFSAWLAMVARSQAEQPHWAPAVGIVSPCLQQVFRYDITQQSLKGGRTLTIYGSGKGLEFIPAERIQFIIGVPPYETENTTPAKSGWGDQMFLMKYRIAAANEQEGNYVLTAFFGMTVPNGGENFSLDHYTFTPTVAFGKGWGDFDFQSTINMTFPDNGAAHSGAGTPLAVNGVWQYRVAKIFWPEVEANYTWWPNGTHEGLNQLFITPGLVLGRFNIWNRVAAGIGAGCQVAVTQNALVHRNLILSMRVMF